MMLCPILELSVNADESSYEVDEESKTIVVNALYDDEDYLSNTGIQDAINYIYNSALDKTEWTITVNEGTYVRFEILSGLDGLTIQAADEAEVIIPVLDGSPALTTEAYSEFGDSGGVELRAVGDVTLDGLTFVAGDGISASGSAYGWTGSAITDIRYYNANDSENRSTNGLTIKNCTFLGNETVASTSWMAVFLSSTTEWAVENCTFDTWYSAICWMCDGYRVVDITIDGNTFINCDRAADGYYGNGNNVMTEDIKGTFAFTNNVVTGTEDLYCKVLISDQYPSTEDEDHDATGYVTISGNTLTNAEFLLLDIEENLINDIVNDNTYGDNSFVAMGSEATSVFNVVLSFSVSDNQTGYWEALSTEELYRVGVEWTEGEQEIILAAIEEANATGSHTLVLDFSSLYAEDTEEYTSNWAGTVVRVKYGIRWVGTTDTDYPEPEVEKSASESTVSAGDVVTFTLTSNVPDSLDLYLADDSTDTIYSESGSYVLVFHDVMDEVFSFNDDVVVTVNGTTVEEQFYTVGADLEDGCSLHVIMDLVALYEEGYFTEEEIEDSPEIVVTYSATVVEDASAGSYENTTWLSYVNGTSETSTVTLIVEVPETETEVTESDEPETSDGSHVYVWLVAMLAAGGLLIAKGIYTMKHNR